MSGVRKPLLGADSQPSLDGRALRPVPPPSFGPPHRGFVVCGIIITLVGLVGFVGTVWFIVGLVRGQIAVDDDSLDDPVWGGNDNSYWDLLGMLLGVYLGLAGIWLSVMMCSIREESAQARLQQLRETPAVWVHGRAWHLKDGKEVQSWTGEEQWPYYRSADAVDDTPHPDTADFSDGKFLALDLVLTGQLLLDEQARRDLAAFRAEFEERHKNEDEHVSFWVERQAFQPSGGGRICPSPPHSTKHLWFLSNCCTAAWIILIVPAIPLVWVWCHSASFRMTVRKRIVSRAAATAGAA